MNSPASCPGTGRLLRPQHRLPDPPSPFNTQSATRPPAPARSASRVTIRHAMSASGHAYGHSGDLQPDVGHEVLWVIRECLSGLVLLARALLSSACDELAGLLREVAADLAALGVPVNGVV